MELDELKNAWTSVDERLNKQEMLNTRIIQEILRDKSNKSLNKMMNTEVGSLVILLLVIPLCIWALNYFDFVKFFFPKIIFISIIAVSIFGIISSCYTLKYYFMKIDFSKSVKDNMYYVNKFNNVYRKGKMINYFIITPVFSLLGILSYYELKVPFYLWIFLFVLLINGIGTTYWIYKKVYDASIESIQKSLEELKELEE